MPTMHLSHFTIWPLMSPLWFKWSTVANPVTAYDSAIKRNSRIGGKKRRKKRQLQNAKFGQQNTHLQVWPCQKCFRWTEPKNTFAETLTGTIIFSRHNVKQTEKGENCWDTKQKTIEIQSICKSFLAVIYKKQIACSVMHGDTKCNYISTM